MRLVDKRHILSNGGSCADCNDPYSAMGYDGKIAYSCLVEYDGITEPMNLCGECLESMDTKEL